MDKKIVIGEPWPADLLETEGVIPYLHPTSFDMLGFFFGLTQVEIENWMSGEPFQYALFEEDNIPFFLVRIGDGKYWEFDASFNFLVEDPDITRSFLCEDESSVVFLYLTDLETGTVQAIREIKLDKEVMESFRKVGLLQLQQYTDEDEIDDATDRIREKYSLDDMLERSFSGLYRC